MYKSKNEIITSIYISLIIIVYIPAAVPILFRFPSIRILNLRLPWKL